MELLINGFSLFGLKIADVLAGRERRSVRANERITPPLQPPPGESGTEAITIFLSPSICGDEEGWKRKPGVLSLERIPRFNIGVIRVFFFATDGRFGKLMKPALHLKVCSKTDVEPPKLIIVGNC